MGDKMSTNISSQVSVPRDFLIYEEEEIDQLKAGSVGKKGHLNVKFKVGSNGKTYISDQFVTLPFHITRGLYNDPKIRDMVFLYLQTPSGGIAQGDRHIMNIECLEDSKVHLTTQGASKIYRMNQNYGLFDVTLKAHKGAYVEYLPDPTILFRDSRFLQSINFEVDKESTVLYSEIIIPGRIALGESFQYKIYHSTLKVRDENGKTLFKDSIVLSPEKHDFKTLGTMGGYDILGNLYIISPGINSNEISDLVHKLINENENEDIGGGATVLPNDCGVLLRVLGHNSRTVSKVLNRAWDEVRKSILGVEAPRMRKY